MHKLFNSHSLVFQIIINIYYDTDVPLHLLLQLHLHLYAQLMPMQGAYRVQKGRGRNAVGLLS